MFLKETTYIFHEIFVQKELFGDAVGLHGALLMLQQINRVLLKKTPRSPWHWSCVEALLLFQQQFSFMQHIKP